MREVTINGYNVSTYYLGVVGEHNATKLIITPPAEIVNDKVAYYRVLFKLRNKADPVITTEYYSTPIEVNLVQSLTINSSLSICVVAYDSSNEYLGISKKIDGFYFDSSDYNALADHIDESYDDPVIGLKKILDSKASIEYVDTKCEEIEETLDNKVDKEDGKGLSTNDFTDEYKTELDEAYQDKHTHDNKEVLDKLGESEDNKLTFNGKEIGGGDEALTDDEIIEICSELSEFVTINNGNYLGIDSETAIAF